MMYENVAHIATTFSYGQRASFSLYERMEPVTDGLKRIRKAAGLTVRAMAEALDVPTSTYAANEDPKKNKKPIIPLDLAKRIIKVVEPRGVPPADVLRLAGVTGELTATPPPPRNNDADEWIEVIGSVAAGVWKAQTEWSASERYDVRFGASQYRSGQRFGLRMEGLSMNRTIPPGADLECLWVRFSRVPPQVGSLVIVERTAHDLVELTCKRLDRDGEGWLLRCESSEPEFQEPIRIGEPDADTMSDDEIRVVAVVLSAKLDLAPTGLSERRYRN